MMAPLMDSRGNVRYFIGAQIDVSGLVKDCSDLEAFQRMLDQQEGLEDEDEPKSDFRELSEMFDHSELQDVRKYGGNMHREHFDDTNDTTGHGASGQRVLIQDQSTMDLASPDNGLSLNKADGRLSGPYKHVSKHLPPPSPMQRLTQFIVSPRSTSTFSPYSLYLSLSTSSRHPTITFPRPCWWEPASSRLSSQCLVRWQPWRHGKDSMARPPLCRPRKRTRRGTTTMDPLHTSPRRVWLSRCMDGGSR